MILPRKILKTILLLLSILLLYIMSYKEDIQNIAPIIYKHNSNNTEDIIQRIFPNSEFDNYRHGRSLAFR